MGERQAEYDPIQQELPSSLTRIYRAIAERYSKPGSEHDYDAKDEIAFADSATRQEKLEGVANESRNELEKIQRVIENFATAIGVQFDPQTGEVYFGAKRDPNMPIPRAEDMKQVESELDTVAGEHHQATKALYGDQLKPDPKRDDETPIGQGKVAHACEQKFHLMQRDNSKNRLLDAKVNLEVAKDRLDMHMACHVAEKYRIMMMLEKAKIALLQRMSMPGAKETDMSVQLLKQEIMGFTHQLAALETQFELSNASYAKEFKAAVLALKDSQKDVEYEDKKIEGVKDKYSETVTFSDDGIRKESCIHGRKNDCEFEEREIYSANGNSVIGEEDVLSRSRTITIGSIVVECITEFNSNGNVEVSSYIGETEMLEYNSTSNEVEQKPDFGEELDNTKTGATTRISIMQKVGTEVTNYIIRDMLYSSEVLQMIPADQDIRKKVADALLMMGFDRATRSLSIESFRDLICPGIDAAIATQKEQSKDDDFGERKGPYDTSNNQ